MRPRWRSERPEAIDGASLATAASAKDGDPAGFLTREEWRRSRQGKKLDACHCVMGDRGAAGLRPDQPIEEAVWSGRLTGIVQGGNGSSECPGLCPAKARKSSLPCRPVRCIPSDAVRCETKANVSSTPVALFGADYAMPSGHAGSRPKSSMRSAPSLCFAQPSIRARQQISAPVLASPAMAFRCWQASVRQARTGSLRSRARTP